ncbi:single-stranded DNA-binding protein [Anaerobacillus isosaccharinicus]|uniref:Single-stranded DNA-binding protein n=1 Tax=Anaerobacillus isosaccharinicus TaxID=1532552 RepID=A0A1S2L3H3_9BACI|nr:single-stranded DNA-binding protein [Anaerobacillus isosaccharinicus]MBA5588931.1 single-stranded DNA-binding protein [Anaerobacillus isosaccharinicus]QOY37658.1 single-stranded DNA-binding protein [Anaerobacillus isosaccharinicus]
MLNSVNLIGRLTRKPEMKYTPNGIAVGNVNLAVNRAYLNQEGKREADFIQVIAWKKLIENAATHLDKGSLISVEARIQTRSYENNEGKKVFVTEIVADKIHYLDTKGKGNNSSNNNNSNNNTSYDNNDPFAGSDPFADNLPDDDGLPF